MVAVWWWWQCGDGGSVLNFLCAVRIVNIATGETKEVAGAGDEFWTPACPPVRPPAYALNIARIASLFQAIASGERDREGGGGGGGGSLSRV